MFLAWSRLSLQAGSGHPAAALEKHALVPAETMLIGCRADDIRSGQAADVATCLLDRGAADVASLPDLRIKDYAALLAYLQESPE